MLLTFDELDGDRLLSPKLWKGFAPPSSGPFPATLSGNPAIGMFDDFLAFGGLSEQAGYYMVETGTGTVTRALTDFDNSSASQKLLTNLGAAQFLATADNDEAILAWSGSSAEAQFKLDSSVGYGDLVFEARVLSDVILADDWAWFIGLIEGGGQATVQCFDNGQDPASLQDQLGFLKLMADSTGVDTYCKNQATADQGTVDVHTNVASEYVKLGFRWDATADRVSFFVNGVEKNSFALDKKAITAALADSFPDDNYMTPIIAVVTDQATDMTLDVDWWACAQYVN